MWSRRDFLKTSTTAVGAAVVAPTTTLSANLSRDLTVEQRGSLFAALARADEHYDASVRMLRLPVRGHGYHSAIQRGLAHPARESLTYAAALLDTKEPPRIARARDILRTVTALQDQDPQSSTYGIWPWYLEEPVKKMPLPDGHSADFCSVPLLAALIEHNDRLGPDLSEDVRTAVFHAARSIQRHETSPSQTNLAIVGTYVTLVASSHLKLPDLREHAFERLRRLHRHITSHGSFSEYNSPSDTSAAIAGLSRMLSHVRDDRARQLISDLHDLAWKHAASHFHPPTKQWAGPHSRCDDTDLRKQREILALLDAGTRRRARLIDDDPLPLGLEAYRLPLNCPRRFVRLFHDLWKSRQTVETFVNPNPEEPGGRGAIVGTTWLSPHYSMGSVNRGDCWEQRRPVLLYWGTPRMCAHLRIRVLLNEHDFASGLLFSTQHEGQLIAAIVFATDHGNTHPRFDELKDASIVARDLRLRFDFGGDLKHLVIRQHPAEERTAVFEDGVCRFVVRPVAGGFDGKPWHWAISDQRLTDRLDAIAYHGAEVSIKLSALASGFFCFSIQEWPRDKPLAELPRPEFSLTEGTLKMALTLPHRKLQISGPSKPKPFAELNDAFVTETG